MTNIIKVEKRGYVVTIIPTDEAFNVSLIKNKEVLELYSFKENHPLNKMSVTDEQIADYCIDRFESKE